MKENAINVFTSMLGISSLASYAIICARYPENDDPMWLIHLKVWLALPWFLFSCQFFYWILSSIFGES